MDFWDVHPGIAGVVYLFFLCYFPRITLLFQSVVFGALSATFLGFLGWLLVPHFTVALLATLTYWDTNPVLCLIAWYCAIDGEKDEKTAVVKTAATRDPRNLANMAPGGKLRQTKRPGRENQ